MSGCGNLNRDEIVRLLTLGRRAERRGKALEGCLTAIVESIIIATLGGFLFMLAVGVIHNSWIPAVPPVGYWTAVVIWALLPALPVRVVTSKKDAP